MAQPWLTEKGDIDVQKEPFFLKSKKNKAIFSQVMEDCKDMDEYAKPARDAAKEAIQGYMALSYNAKQAGRSNLFIPKIHSIVYARLAMEAANIPKVEYKARKSSSKQKMKFLNAAKNNAEQGDDNLRPSALNLWFHQNFDKVLLGTGFRFLTYLYQTRVVQVKNDEGEVVSKVMTVHDDVWDEVPDFFHVGVSRDMQQGMIGGRACYYDKYYTKDHFLERFDNPMHHDVKRAAESIDWAEHDCFNTNHTWNVPQNMIRVRFYWDAFKDLYYVVANGIPIRMDFILDHGPWERPKKFLPITSIHNTYNYDMQAEGFENFFQDGRQYSGANKTSTNKTFWSKGDAKLVQGLVAFSNSIWRAAADNTKASSVHFLMTNSAGVYDQIRTADLYGIVPLKASGDSFDVKSLTEGSDYLNKFTGMDDSVDNLMIFALGNDYKRAAAELTNEKATVAAIRQQVQRVHLNLGMKMNESGGIKRHYRVLLNLIQQYYPQKSERQLIEGEDPADFNVEEQDIVRDRDGHPVAVKVPKEVPIEDEIVMIGYGANMRVVGIDHPDAEGKVSAKMFLSHKSLLVTEEEPEIYVEEGSAFAELTALERAQDLEFLQTIGQFFQLAYDGKPVIPKEGAEYIIRQTTDSWDKIDPDKVFDKKEEDELLDENLLAPFTDALDNSGEMEPTVPQPSEQPLGVPPLGNEAGPAASAGLLASALTP